MFGFSDLSIAIAYVDHIVTTIIQRFSRIKFKKRDVKEILIRNIIRNKEILKKTFETPLDNNETWRNLKIQ